jgi:hypothetical protein
MDKNVDHVANIPRALAKLSANLFEMLRCLKQLKTVPKAI